MVSDLVVLGPVRADLVTTLTRADLLKPVLPTLGESLFTFILVKPCGQDLHGYGTVLVL